MFVCGIPAQKYWDKGYESWEEPGCGDHSHRRVGIHEVIVVERLADRVKPVNNENFYCCNVACIIKMNIDFWLRLYWKAQINGGPKHPPGYLQFTCRMKWHKDGEWRRWRRAHQLSSKSHKLQIRKSIFE